MTVSEGLEYVEISLAGLQTKNFICSFVKFLAG